MGLSHQQLFQYPTPNCLSPELLMLQIDFFRATVFHLAFNLIMNEC